MEDKSFVTTDEKQENRHHIFTKKQVRDAVIAVFGEPKNEDDDFLITRETNWNWKHLPRYKLLITKHRLIHQNKTTKPRGEETAIIFSNKKLQKLRENGDKMQEYKKKVNDKVNEINFLRNQVKTLRLKLNKYEGDKK